MLKKTKSTKEKKRDEEKKSEVLLQTRQLTTEIEGEVPRVHLQKGAVDIGE